MSEQAPATNMEPGQPTGAEGNLLKPCCECVEERKAMEACVEEKGEENCQSLVEAHSACLRKLGFDV